MSSRINEGVVPGFAEMTPDTVITEKGLADMLGRHRVSIKRAVQRGELPPPVKLFGQRVWTAQAICEHLNKRLEAARRDTERSDRRISALAS